MSIKNKFPFRVGTSSYIIPDDIIPNIKYLSREVDDIEILLFESDDISNLPDSSTIDEMVRLANKNNLTYNIHLPVDIALGATDESIRINSVRKCLRVINLMKDVNPLAYILHLTGNPNIMGEGSSETIEDWFPSLHKSLSELTESGINPSLICVETLSYPFQYLDKLIDEFNLSVCLDIGHLTIYGYSVLEHIDKYLEKTKVIHLHGIVDGNDHKDISNLPKELLDYLITAITNNKLENRILTVEVFNEIDFINSRNVLEGYIK